MGRLPAIALFAADDEAAAAEDDVPMFKREDAAADAAATDPPPVLRPATCAASDRRVTAAAAEEHMVEQGMAILRNLNEILGKNLGGRETGRRETGEKDEQKWEWRSRLMNEDVADAMQPYYSFATSPAQYLSNSSFFSRKHHI